MKYSYYLFIIIFLFIFNNGNASRFNPYGTDWMIGFHFGGTSFFGDLRSESGGLSSTPFSKYFYKDMRMMGGITVDKWFGPYIGMTGNMQYGKIQGTKETSDSWFEANLFEYNLSASVNLSNVFFGVDRRRHWMIYSSIGLGMTESRSWKYAISTEKQIGTNGFGTPKTEDGKYIPMSEAVIPMALGIKFFIGGNATINFEGSFHTINSDKLDATPNVNTSFIAGIEGYTYYSVGIGFWLNGSGPSNSRNFRRRPSYGGGRSQYSTINSRKSSSNNKIFRKGRKRFKFTRR